MIFLDENKIKEDYDRFMSLIEEDPRSENLKRMYEDLEQEFKSLVISALESIGVDPESHSDDRDSYRDREHSSY